MATDVDVDIVFVFPELLKEVQVSINSFFSKEFFVWRGVYSSLQGLFDIFF